MASFETHSGLAGEIRSSLVSEQYDLSGYTEARSKDLIHAAFGTVLTAPTEMVRFTFVVGGGKLVRSRYADELPKWLSAALREVGYAEDRSAAETFDSQGTFKQQHDTGQNLKYLIVYPRLACASSSTSTSVVVGAAPAVDPSSPSYVVQACDLSMLREIVASKTRSWAQRRRLLKVLQEGQERFREVEAKLVIGAALTPAEQQIYDLNSGAEDEKIAWVQGECRRMVEAGTLTAREKVEVASTVAASLAAVLEEQQQAQAEQKPKKAEKLAEKAAQLRQRLAVVEAVVPVVFRFSNSEQCVKVRLQLLVLAALEEKTRSMSLTLADLEALGRKSGLEEDLQQLELASRGWFEVEEEVEAMRALDVADAKARYAARLKQQQSSTSKGKGTASGAGRGSSVGRSVVGSSTVAGNSWGVVAGKKSAGAGAGTAKKAGSSGGGFAAAFADSDSD